MGKKIPQKKKHIHHKKNFQHPQHKKQKVSKDINRTYLFIIIGVLLIITLIAFFPSLKNGFVTWDDEDYLHNNLQFIGDLSREGIARIFNINSVIMGIYHPLTILSYAIIYHYHELDPYPFHLYNVILHLLNTVLVFWFILKITNKNLTLSFATAILFGVHPLHVESVTWVSETKDVLYAFFFLLSLIAYTYYSADRKKLKFYFLAIILFILSCLSKGMAVTLSVVLVAIDYLLERKFVWKLLIEKIPFFIISLIFGILAIHAQSISSAIYQVPEYSFFNQLMMPVYSFMFYIYKMIWPAGLAIIHPYPPPDAIPAIYYISFVVFIALVVFTMRSFKKYPEVIFGIGFYFFCILPVLQLIPIGQAVASERYFYVSSIGLLFLVGVGFNSILNKKIFNINIGKSSWALLAMVVIIMTYLTNQRTRVWENGLTLWSSQKDAYPEFHRGYYGIGLHYYNLGDYPKAISYYKQCINRNPANVKALNNLGNSYQHQNNPDSAYYYYQRLLEVDTNYANVYVNLGNIYLRRQDFDKSIQSYKKAIAIDNNFGMAYYGLGIVLETRGDKEEAMQNYLISARLGFKMARDLLQKRGVSY